MKILREVTERLLRGPRACGLLQRLGIDARRYWLLVDLFGQLSERGEILDQLGRNGVALQAATWMYAFFSLLFSVLLVATHSRPAAYFSTFLVYTAFLMLSVLLSETANSLVNPVEGLILAHQPVGGATYTAAKLTHLVRIILYLVPGINAVPAFAGLILRGSRWSYPIVHLLGALAVGLLAGLLCCALYGWLMRLVPVRRLKAAGQLAGTMPLLVMLWWQPMRDFLTPVNLLHWLPAEPAARWALAMALGAAAAAIVGLGVRSLSADYLIRVSGILHGSSAAPAAARESRMGGIAARLFGGQPGRAGFDFVSRMARRDFQFRRQVAPLLIVGLMSLVPLLARGWRIDPFSGRFTGAHLLPHLFGMVLFFMCNFLPYGNDFKGAWIFQLIPVQAFGGVARGIYGALWLQMIAVPHMALFLLFAWPWGAWHAGLFTAYSLATASVYLGLELRLIDGAPFSKQMDPARGATLLPLMIAGGLAMAVAVGLQYFYVFRAAATVVEVTAAVGVAAYYLTRSSLGAVAGSIRYHLGLLSAESGRLYQEVDI